MLVERSRWSVNIVRDGRRGGQPEFGNRRSFGTERRYSQTGIKLAVLEPGQPDCRYHRENAQEDSLALFGECLLIADDETRKLKAWDLVHCPHGVSHVFVGAGDPRCAILMIGHRPPEHQLYYLEGVIARRYSTESREPTNDPRVVYADVSPRQDEESPDWP
ncbi:MAG: hypothetical protein JSV80_09045 [Acidobacteriota bacterium]|nr:MAG: hypothetical protein JSV80_09045 [Acidobacteriota bacterium]